VIGYLDCSTGVSGDKLLGALLDAGTADGRFTAADLAAIAAMLAPEARVVVERVSSRGVSALGVRVLAEGQPHSRSWSEIRTSIGAADLPAPVAEMAARAFGALAQAEATVHGTAVDDVHFHEVGAIDSIVDMVGACAGLHALGITSLLATPVAVGSGTVETSHGTLPVPAPATALLLQSAAAPVVTGPATGELTTPTGAALLAACVEGFSAMPPLTIIGIGYGAGTRDIGVPNVCRLILGEESPVANHETGDGLTVESVTVLETNLDHLSPEELAFACEEILAEGSLDVWQTPVVMKKGRLAVVLSVLAAAADAPRLAARVSELTGSLGVRARAAERFVAPREVLEVPTEWGIVRVKAGAGRLRPEHEDVARIARETGRSYADVARRATQAARNLLGSAEH
jgi:pyridinium-3,5-bisthiocarboxylic acid mononucleotide nickel chelatase